MFEPLPVQVGNDYRNGGLAKESHCRLDRAREWRYHDEIDGNVGGRLPCGSDLLNADLGQARIKVQRINAVHVKECIERGLPMPDQMDVFRHRFCFAEKATTVNLLSRSYRNNAA